MKAYTVIENIKKTVELLTAPAVSVCAVWGLDIATYGAATAGVITCVLSYVQLFLDPNEVK